MPVPVWHELLTQTVALRPGPGTPLAIGALVKPRHVGVLGYLVLASHSLAEALQVYQRYERLFYGASLAQVVASGDEVEIRWPRQPLVENSLHDQLGIAALVTFMRQQVDQPPIPAGIRFCSPAPGAPGRAAGARPRRHRIEACFGCPVDFGQDETAVRIPLHYLALPLLHSDPGLRQLQDQQPRALLQAMPGAFAFTARCNRRCCGACPRATPRWRQWPPPCMSRCAHCSAACMPAARPGSRCWTAAARSWRDNTWRTMASA